MVVSNLSIGRRLISRLSFAAVLLVGIVAFNLQVLSDQPPKQPASDSKSESADPPIPPATEGLSYDELIAEIERQIDAHSRDGRDALANELRERLAAVKKIAETGELPPSKSLELHAIGLYQGQPFDLVRFQATVRVTHTAAPIILLLCSYEPIQWNLDVADGVQLKQVILGGGQNRGQTVKGLPAGASLADYSRQGISERRIGTSYSRKPIDSSGDTFAQLDAHLFELTGLHIQTFHGAHHAREEPIVIGPESESWRADRALVAAKDAYELATRRSRDAIWHEIKDLRFPAIYLTRHSGNRGNGNDPFQNPFQRPGETTTAVFGTHSVLGPLEFQVRELELPGKQTKLDPRGPIELPFQVFSAETGKWTTIKPDGFEGMPRFSHVCAQA